MNWFDDITTFLLNYFSISILLFIFWCVREIATDDLKRQLQNITPLKFIYGLFRTLLLLPIIAVQILWREL